MPDNARSGDLPPQVLPFDAANRRLLANVHPQDWQNPTPQDKYDLVVLGAGTGGLVSAAIGAALGARVALVERHLMGGDCLNVGCVPSKAVLRAARAWRDARRAAADFGGPGTTGEGDFAAVMERMRELRAGISEHDSARRFRELGVDVFLGQARFLDAEQVQVAGERLRFRRAIVATGARASAPPIPGLEEAGYLTNETVFSLTELPPRLLVIGGGPIGCELAQAFARFGSQVTLVETAGHLLPREDPEAARIVRSALERDGVDVLTEAQIDGVAAASGEQRIRLRHEGAARELLVDRILVSAGRSPNVEDLGLEAAGVRFDRRGVQVDDRLRTSSSRIYAVGDVNALAPFTHAADAQARLVVQNALFFGRGRWSKQVVPHVTYTSPELAQVGISATEAAERGAEVESLTIPLREVDRARLEGDTEGFLRVHLKRGSDRILGATLVAEHAGEIISQITSAMNAEIGLEQLGGSIFPYPTRAEVVRKAADARRRHKLTSRVKRGFELFFRLTR